MVDAIDPLWLHNDWSFHKVCGKMFQKDEELEMPRQAAWTEAQTVNYN